MQSGSYWSYREAAELPDRDDDDSPTRRTLRYETHTARKVHRCDACGQPINVGERYEVDVYTEDGAFRLTRMHALLRCAWPPTPDTYDVPTNQGAYCAGGCGSPVAEPGLCGECACEDDGDLY